MRSIKFLLIGLVQACAPNFLCAIFASVMVMVAE